MYASMRCFHLGRVIFCVIFVAHLGRRAVVTGMPMEMLDGSNACGLHFRTIAAKESYSRIAFEVLYRDPTFVPANSTKCNLELSNEAARQDIPTGTKRAFNLLQVRLTRENSEFFKIFVDKEAQDWFESNVNSFTRIVCPNRKFSCIRFPSVRKGASRVGRSLLSIDQLYTYENPGTNVPLKPLILMLAGAVILVAAGSLCADCNKTKDDESISEARPELVAVQQRTSQHKFTPEEQQVHEEVVFESKDVVVMETAEKIEDSIAANNHNPLTTIADYEPPPTSVQRELPSSTQASEKPSGTHHTPPSGTQHVPLSGKPYDPHALEAELRGQSNNQTSGSQPEPEAGDRTSRASKPGSAKKKRGSEHEHEQEEHKGKFWKRTRSSKASSASGTGKPADRTSVSGLAQSADGTSDAVFKEEEHKKQRSKKESKEQKMKSGKTKGRTDSTESEKEKDENHALHDDHIERPRVATPTLERHSRGLPAPPGNSGPALPVRPVPQRQASAPDGVEDDNYDVVITRKTKSMERFKAAPSFVDNEYEVVEGKVGKPRLPSVELDSVDERGNDTQRTSDIYEVVDDTNITVDDLYSEVLQTGEEESENEEPVEGEDVDKEDPYSRIKYQKQLEAERDSEPYDNVEDPHSKMKMPKQEEETENSELYEDVEKRQESGDKNHKYAKVNKEEVVRLMIENEAKTESGDRNRSQSDATVLQRSGNELPKRPNTIHVMQSARGEVTQTEGEASSLPFDYTYAEVDKSKKTRRPRNTEGGDGIEEENWDSDNPPPLPPAYISSRQIQIEMGRNADPENLYDEIATASEQDRPPNMELLTPEDESKRLSSVSGDYELVEVPPMPVRMTADEYTEVVERDPRPKASSGRTRPVQVEICGAPSNIAVTVTSSTEAKDKTVDGEEIPHYEAVAPRKELKERPRLSSGEWV